MFHLFLIINVTFSLLINLENVEKKKMNIKIIHDPTTTNIMFLQTYFTVNIHIHTKMGYECVQYFEICLNHFLEHYIFFQILFCVTAVTWNDSSVLYLVFPVKFKRKINLSFPDPKLFLLYLILFCYLCTKFHLFTMIYIQFGIFPLLSRKISHYFLCFIINI